MKKIKTLKIICMVTIALTSFTGLVVLADSSTVTENPNFQYITGSNSIFGKFYVMAKMTNTVNGTYLVKPDTNIVVSSGTFTDISGYAAPYSSYVVVGVSGKTNTYCASNNVTFPATNSLNYTLTIYVTSPPPPPTNNEPLTLQVHWQ
jgi:hypothetical protein